MIIAVCGFRGSGKSLFGSVAKKMEFPVFEMSAPILGLMRELGMVTTNESVRTFATDFREKGGQDAVARLILPNLRAVLQEKKAVVVIGVRSVSELDAFRTVSPVVSVAIASDEQARFGRIAKRGKKTDPKTLEQFRWADQVEEKWGLKKLLESCEVKIENNEGETIFREKAKDFLEKYR
ncbi:MAG: hypothetical protein PHS02_04375 [Candidatus ainarchaeum sp.]|nr:hypothetical protein [Candidatus ainarchaeum sp.]